MSTELRILILEDNAFDRELLCNKLQGEGFALKPVCVSSRAEFVAALARGSFDLVLSDYMLPQFNGLSALQVARESQPDIPFILVSGAVGEEQAVECLKAGATDYILKRSLARLGSAVRRALSDAEDRKRQDPHGAGGAADRVGGGAERAGDSRI